MPKRELNFEDLDKVFPEESAKSKISDDELLDLVRNPKAIGEKSENEQVLIWEQIAERMNLSESFKKSVYNTIEELLK